MVKEKMALQLLNFVRNDNKIAVDDLELSCYNVY